MMERFKKNKKGFTLVEIIVVLVILAILAVIAIPTMLGYVEEARGKALTAEARSVYVSAQALITERVAMNDTNIPGSITENSVVGAIRYGERIRNMSGTAGKFTITVATGIITQVQYTSATSTRTITLNIGDNGSVDIGTVAPTP